MKGDRLRRVSAPGLPPWPRLLFDSESRRAQISVRHPTWRSEECSLHATELVCWAVTCGLAVLIWRLLPQRMDMVGRVLLVVLLTGVAWVVVKFLLHWSVGPFLARQLFATRTEFWFSPQAILLRSRLYARPVIVWRKWGAQPVRLRFILQEDREALSCAQNMGPKRKLPTAHLKESMMLELVLTTVDRRPEVSLGSRDALLRTIPITEVNSRWATNFTMVLAAAAMLTAPTQQPVARGASGGVDIDVG